MPETENERKGRQGEKELDRLADYAGFTVHSPSVDMHGWDQLWEMQLSPKPGVSLDQRPGVLNVFVQAKTTDSRDHEDVSLSVLERAAKDSRPFFFAFVIRGPDRRPTDFHLVHIGEKHISKVLKRLREAEVKGTQDTIHRQTVRLSVAEGHRIGPDDSDALKAHILGVVGDPVAYTKWKHDLIEKAGYERGSHRMTVKLGPGVTDEDFADAMLGIRPGVTAQSMKMADMRFGIPLPQHEVEGGSLLFKPVSYGKVSVALEAPGCKRVEMRLDFFQTYPGVPIELRKFRLSNEVVTFLVHPHKDVTTISFETGDACPLRDLEAAADIVSFIAQAPKVFQFEVVLPGKEGDIVWRPGCGRPEAMVIPEGLTKVLRGAKAMSQFARLLNYRLDEELVDCEEVESIANNLAFFWAAVDSGVDHTMKIHEMGAPEGPYVWERTVFLMEAVLPSEKYNISLVFRLDGVPQREEIDGATYLSARGPMKVLDSRRLLRRATWQEDHDRFINEVHSAECASHPEWIYFATWLAEKIRVEHVPLEAEKPIEAATGPSLPSPVPSGPDPARTPPQQ